MSLVQVGIGNSELRLRCMVVPLDSNWFPGTTGEHKFKTEVSEDDFFERIAITRCWHFYVHRVWHITISVLSKSHHKGFRLKAIQDHVIIREHSNLSVENT